jgi:hypothetical protein
VTGNCGQEAQLLAVPAEDQEAVSPSPQRSEGGFPARSLGLSVGTRERCDNTATTDCEAW